MIVQQDEDGRSIYPVTGVKAATAKRLAKRSLRVLLPTHPVPPSPVPISLPRILALHSSPFLASLSLVRLPSHRDPKHLELLSPFSLNLRRFRRYISWISRVLQFDLSTPPTPIRRRSRSPQLTRRGGRTSRIRKE